MENKFDTQFLIEGHDLDEDAIHDGIFVKVHYHTDTPWKVLEYAAALGELNTIIVENMERQAKGLHG